MEPLEFRTSTSRSRSKSKSLTYQVSFWIADSFNLNTFVIASSMISAGLTWWQAFLCVIIGYSLVGPILVLNARPGAVFGLIFPSVNRTTFGIFGSLWPVFNRTFSMSEK
jgi:NCS1 family nucleobase:cation symporter-1